MTCRRRCVRRRRRCWAPSGVAATPLRPAGKVQFGDEYIDVVAEGHTSSPALACRSSRSRAIASWSKRCCEAASRDRQGAEEIRSLPDGRGSPNGAYGPQQLPDPGLRPDRRWLSADGGRVVLHQRHAVGAGADLHRGRRRSDVLPRLLLRRQHRPVHPARRADCAAGVRRPVAALLAEDALRPASVSDGRDEDATVAAMPVNLELEQLRGRIGRALSDCGRRASAISTAGASTPSPRG